MCFRWGSNKPFPELGPAPFPGARGGWSVADCLSAADSHYRGEQSCLALGGAADNSWRRQIQRLATAGTQLEVAITTKRSSQYQNLQCPESVALTLGSGSSGLCLLCLSCDPLYRGPQRHLLKTRDCENEPGMHRSSCYNLKVLDQKPEDLGSGSKTTWSKSL